MSGYGLIDGKNGQGGSKLAFVVDDALYCDGKNHCDGVLVKRYERFQKHSARRQYESIRPIAHQTSREKSEEDRYGVGFVERDVLTWLIDRDGDDVRRYYGVQALSKGLLFVQPWCGEGKVVVAGDFNCWSESKDQLIWHRRFNVWFGFIGLEKGRYRYRLVVDGDWREDHFNHYVEANEYGGQNHIAICY